MEFHIVLNSNPWFSAVTDYSLQLAKFVSTRQTTRVVYCAPAGSIALRKADQSALPTNPIPLFPFTLARFFAAWHALGELVRSHKPSVVWVFEGREHTLCAVHRLIHKRLWSKTRIIRVRGQASPVAPSLLNKWVYTRGVSGVAFAAEIVRQRTAFDVPEKQRRVHLYCTAKVTEPAVALESAPRQIAVSREFSLDFSHPTFTIVARYDPVKGHSETIQALSLANFQSYLRNDQWIQIVFIGESQNISASRLIELAQNTFNVTAKKITDSRWLLEAPEKRIRLLVLDERLRDIAVWMRQSSFGLIPSLGSEVICRVAVEFLQQGTPLVSSNVGALAEVLPRSCALIYESNNSQELAAALEKALVLFNQPDAFSMMRRNALEHGRRFGPEGWSGLVTWARTLEPFSESHSTT
ncbi:MAG: glycosyltransferase family 4 protein [Betaproteobacteria bacterium]|nr:glycosyltransferase family 4 protein [Betaproteobacteria bacterium]